MKKKAALCMVFIVLLVFSALSGCTGSYNAGNSGDLVLNFLDVGQGDSIFISLPNGDTILIDAGEQENAPSITKFIQDQGVSTLTYVIATHPHADHIGGLAKVIAAFEVENVYMPKASSATKTFENLLDTIEGKGLSVQTAKAGKVLFDYGDIKGEFIAPNQDSYSNLNNVSAALKLTYKSKIFLLMGDAESGSETEILDKGFNVSADVLKLGHHGSDTSTSERFLQAVHPSTAIISVGEGNKYNHPASDTLARLKKIGAAVWRTDEKGTIIVTCDGDKISVKNR